MQKLIYSLWKTPGISSETFRQTLLNTLSPQIISLGSKQLRICVVDQDVAAAAPYRIISDTDPVDGLLTIWLDSYLYRGEIESAIQQSVDRLSAYAVWESEPLVAEQTAPLGQRSDGMNEVVFLRKPARLDYQEWLHIWHTQHTQVAIDTQSTFGYRQNVVTQTLTANAKHHDAIIEENFPPAAISSRMAFYAADDDKELYRAREKIMVESCAKFIDFDDMDCIPMSEYIMQ